MLFSPDLTSGTRTANKARNRKPPRCWHNSILRDNDAGEFGLHYIYVHFLDLDVAGCTMYLSFRRLVAETSEEKMEHVHAEIERLSQVRQWEIPSEIQDLEDLWRLKTSHSFIFVIVFVIRARKNTEEAYNGKGKITRTHARTDTTTPTQPIPCSLQWVQQWCLISYTAKSQVSIGEWTVF